MSDDRAEKERIKISPISRGSSRPPGLRGSPIKQDKVIPRGLLNIVNLDTLSDNIANAFETQGMGYCFMIGEANKILHVRASGWAQRPGDGETLWAPHIPTAVASVSKVLTAMATIQTLRAACVAPESPILPYLPRYWFKGPGIEKVTFRDLLRHETGLGTSYLRGGPGDFQSAKNVVRLGTSGLDTKTYDYKNANFALLRCLLPVVEGSLQADANMPSGSPSRGSLIPGVNEGASDEFWDRETRLGYIRLVNEGVLSKAQVEPRDGTVPWNCAKAYLYPSSGLGWRPDDGSAGMGPGGWFFNVGELTRLLGAFRRDRILGKGEAQSMMRDRLGFDLPIETEAGDVAIKGGRSANEHRDLDSAICLLPGGANLVIFTNAAPPRRQGGGGRRCRHRCAGVDQAKCGATHSLTAIRSKPRPRPRLHLGATELLLGAPKREPRVRVL